MPHINGPFTPDLATEVGTMTAKAKTNDWPLKVEWGLIGSCTNSSYEDLSRAASIAQQALDKGLVTKAEFGINPGSEQVRFTAERDGILEVFENLDAKIFTNACGPCIGQWARYEDPKNAPKNSIVHSFNRNFAKRADGNPNTHAFVASPEMVAAIAISGRLDFNPLTDALINKDGEKVMLDEPTFPGCVVSCRVIGMFRMTDEKGGDDKLLCVAAGDIRKSNLTDLKDVPTYELEEIKHFFEVYKTLEPGKEVHGGEWVGHDAAELEINASYKRYTDSH